MDSLRIASVGHSNRSLEQLLHILHAHDITYIADVRIHPRSRYLPHFNSDALAAGLANSAIGYGHFRDLGGYRKARPDSPHTALEGSFRGYADHMQTPAFERALAALLATAAENRLAMLCAEANPLDCHRSLIADTLLARGIIVSHLLTHERTEPHRLRPEGRLVQGRVLYDGHQLSLL